MSTSEIDQSAILDRYPGCPGQPEVDKNCTCPATACALHGNCCACIAWHRDHGLKPLPHCLRSLEEVTWELRSDLPITSVLRGT